MSRLELAFCPMRWARARDLRDRQRNAGAHPERGSWPPACRALGVPWKRTRAGTLTAGASESWPHLRPPARPRARPRSPSPCPGTSRATRPWKLRSAPRSSRFRSPSACMRGTAILAAVREAAGARRFRMVAHDACAVEQRRALQRGPRVRMVGRATSDLPGAGVPHRPADGPARARAGGGHPAARSSPLPADGAPRGLLPDAFPWTSCGGDCPSNAFMVLGSEPGFVDAVIIPFRETATVLLFAGVVLVLAARIRTRHAADAHHARARARGRNPARACHDRRHRGPACVPGRAHRGPGMGRSRSRSPAWPSASWPGSGLGGCSRTGRSGGSRPASPRTARR